VIYRFRDCELNIERLEFRRNGVVQSLEPQVFRLLAHLIEHRHRVVTRNELYDTIWSGRVVAESALYSRIKSVRAAIGDGGPDSIRTVSRTGYQFVAEVVEADAAASEAIAPQQTRPSVEVSPSDQTPKRWWVAGAAVAGTAAVLAAVLALVANRPWSSPTTVSAALPTIAMLPFLDMSAEKDQQYFVDGLYVEMTDRLSRLPGMRVVARASKSDYEATGQDARQVAKTLGAQNLLVGSVRHEGTHLRVTAQLFSDRGKQIWSQIFDRSHEDTLALQQEVSNVITATLSVAVSATGAPASRGGTRNVDAYDAYLSARAALIEPSLASAEKLAFGLSQLELATRIDPDFASAWAWQAIAYHRGGFVPGRGNPELIAKANRAAARAYELAPEETWVLVASALAAMSEFKWAAAEEKFERARAAATSSENPLTGWFALAVGHTDDALKFLKQTQDAEPLFASNALAFAYAYQMRGEFDLADAEIEVARRLVGADPGAGLAHMFIAFSRGDPDIIRASDVPSWAWHPLYQKMSPQLDRPEKALADLRRHIMGQRTGSVSPWGIGPGIWAAYLGDPHLALELIRPVAFDSKFTQVLWAPFLSEMRRLPEFKALVIELKLVDYWRATGRWGDFCKPLGTNDFVCR
jgi:TolB-like protein/DNA-binding winged helix-turn-helix (wHTH) protein